MGSPDAIREELRAWLQVARARTDALFDRLTTEGLSVRAVAERHRFIFYVGHLEVFDWNLLCHQVLGHPPINPKWEQLFAFGIDPVDGQLPSDTPADWPPIADVRGYGRQLRDEVDQAIETAPLTGWLEGGWALRMAIEHRLMHAETLSYLLCRVPRGMIQAHPTPVILRSRPLPHNELISVPAGVATLGLSRRDDPFTGWDNEYQQHRIEVPAFRMQRYPVTNADYLRFIEAGAYAERAFWKEDDWAWRQAASIQLPTFWHRDASGSLFWRGVSDEVPLPLAAPVYVSQAEALAYARWAKLELPTEAQWHRAVGEHLHPWGDAPPLPGHHGNFGFVADDPTDVDAHPAGDSALGIAGLVGNGWQWTKTVFAPFEGFEPLPFYRGYSANFFDGKHLVMKGASPATDVTFLRPSFRNWFQPHYPFVFATFRLVENDPQ